jgi:cytochrome c peroxidase
VENYIKVGRAIAAFERSPEVSAFSSKFDGYLNGKVSLTALELKGMELFNGKAKCSACHISSGSSPLFTDFSYDNLGVPKNPANPYYNVDPDFIDWGLGGFLESIGDATSTDQMGKHKVPTLRNVDKRPGAGFPKDYMHNGVFKSLKEVVHFYNTRDDGSWPAPEVDVNINTTELGNLGLTGAEEDAIVAFMKTLSDGYVKR